MKMIPRMMLEIPQNQRNPLLTLVAEAAADLLAVVALIAAIGRAGRARAECRVHQKRQRCTENDTVNEVFHDYPQKNH